MKASRYHTSEASWVRCEASEPAHPSEHPLSDIYRRMGRLYDRAALRHLARAFHPSASPSRRAELVCLASAAQRAGDRWRSRAAGRP